MIDFLKHYGYWLFGGVLLLLILLYHLVTSFVRLMLDIHQELIRIRVAGEALLEHHERLDRTESRLGKIAAGPADRS